MRPTRREFGVHWAIEVVLGSVSVSVDDVAVGGWEVGVANFEVDEEDRDRQEIEEEEEEEDEGKEEDELLILKAAKDEVGIELWIEIEFADWITLLVLEDLQAILERFSSCDGSRRRCTGSAFSNSSPLSLFITFISDALLIIDSLVSIWKERSTSFLLAILALIASSGCNLKWIQFGWVPSLSFLIWLAILICIVYTQRRRNENKEERKGKGEKRLQDNARDRKERISSWEKTCDFWRRLKRIDDLNSTRVWCQWECSRPISLWYVWQSLRRLEKVEWIDLFSLLWATCLFGFLDCSLVSLWSGSSCSSWELVSKVVRERWGNEGKKVGRGKGRQTKSQKRRGTRSA